MVMLRRTALIAVCVLLVLRGWVPTEGQQTPATRQRPAFDAASIKLHTNGPSLGVNLARPGGHVQLTANLQVLMVLGYDLRSLSEAVNRISGMPNWGTTQSFDIEAEAPGNPTVEQKRLMLQSLLAERFKMAVHRETRQSPVYAMELVSPKKLGPQLHRHAADSNCLVSTVQGTAPGSGPSQSDSPAGRAAAAMQKYPCGRVVGNLLTQGDRSLAWSGGRDVSMDALADGVGTMEYIDHPVVNRTELEGNFDFTVEWDARAADIVADSGANQVQAGDSLFEAMRSQLGVKLELQKAPVDIIVIDHVEQLTQN